MQSKVNIFHSLQHNSDSEEEGGNNQSNKAKKNAEKREQRAQNQVKANVNKPPSTKEDHSKTKALPKQKGVTADPHPLDRHSGHGNQAYGGKPKKQGAGKGNWGNFKEDRKGGDEQVTAGEAAEDVAEDKPQEEEPAGITLSEYYSQRNQAQNAPQVNEAKAKITSEQLTKELGNATALKTRLQQQVDDKKVGKKKDRLDVDHHAAINSEYANLLNFRTGFVEKEYKARGERTEEGTQRRGPRPGQKERENAKEDDTQQATEGQTAEGQPAEGQAPVEGQAQEANAGEGTSPTRAGGDDRRGQRGGYRGGRGGYRGDRADRPQGDRPQGDRPPRKQQQGQTKVNFEDESAFPKLG